MILDPYLMPLLGYLGTVIGLVWTFAYRLSGMKGDMDRRIDKIERLVIEKEASLKGEIIKAMDEGARVVGESLSAIRQKGIDDALWARDNYVRRTDFQNTVDSFTRAVDAIRTEMNAGYLRLDSKLDRLLKEQK